MSLTGGEIDPGGGTLGHHQPAEDDAGGIDGETNRNDATSANAHASGSGLSRSVDRDLLRDGRERAAWDDLGHPGRRDVKEDGIRSRGRVCGLDCGAQRDLFSGFVEVNIDDTVEWVGIREVPVVIDDEFVRRDEHLLRCRLGGALLVKHGQSDVVGARLSIGVDDLRRL